MSKSMTIPTIFICAALSTCKTPSLSDEKLIGGAPVSATDFPATIQLLKVQPDLLAGTNVALGPSCTGALVSRRHVLTAAHCVLDMTMNFTNGKPAIQYRYAVGEMLHYATGPKAEKSHATRIKAIHLRPEVTAYLLANKTWNMKNIELANDVAVIEFSENAPNEVPSAALASANLSKDSPIRYGGYGCETNYSIPAPSAKVPSPQDLGPYGTRLKATQARISIVNGLIAEGPWYKTETLQSGCPGDSGAPVYFDNNPTSSRPARGVEIAGVLSYGRSPNEVPGRPAAEIGFSIVTKGSVLGRWVDGITKGQSSVIASVLPADCLNAGATSSDLYCGNDPLKPFMTSCAFRDHSTLGGFPQRPIPYRECLAKVNGRYSDPHRLLLPFRFDKDGAAKWQDTSTTNGITLYTSKWPSPQGYLCFEGTNLAGLQNRLTTAIKSIGAGGADPLKGKLGFLNQTSITFSVKSVQFESSSRSILITVGSDYDNKTHIYRIGTCNLDYQM